jgi:predicted DNA-binding transcriptional regulator YafY
MNRIDRLFGILLRLQRRRVVRAHDLAQHFAVSERTIYRDIAALNELGVPILSQPNAGYRLPEGFSLPPLLFTPGEAGAVALAVHLLLAQTTGTTNQDAERALAKIFAVLPADLRAQIDDLRTIIQFYALERPFDLTDPRLHLVHQAIRERRVIALRYHSYQDNAPTSRDIEPSTLTAHHGVWYINAYCRLRQATRSFRLDRIETLALTETIFQPQVELPRPVEPVVVRIRFAPGVLRWVRERQHFGFVAEQDDVCTYQVIDPTEMLPWILSWGAQAEVLSPTSLRNRVRSELQLLLEILT